MKQRDRAKVRGEAMKLRLSELLRRGFTRYIRTY